MKKNLCLLFGLVLLTLTALAQVTEPTLPGITQTGQVDTLALINLAIMAVTPVVIQGIKWAVPRLPHFTLNLAAPLIGAGLGYALSAMGVSAAGGWGALLYGAAGTWLYELANSAKKHLTEEESPVATTATVNPKNQ